MTRIVRLTTVCLAGAALASQVAAAPPPQPDLAAGRVLYRTCASCHGATGQGTGAGPDLRGVVGRKAAADPDFAYSAALKRSGKTWTSAELAAFLLKPQSAVPGTRMAYPGAVSSANARALAAYLATLR